MASSRQMIPAKVKEATYRDYGHACWLSFPGCTHRADTLDHVMPYSQGGLTRPSNLRPACRHCNSVRQDRLIQGRGIDVRVVLLAPGDMQQIDAHGGTLMDWRRVLDALGRHSDETWRVMHAMWKSGVWEATRTMQATPLVIVPPFDTPASQVSEWIRLGYAVEIPAQQGTGLSASCTAEAQALAAWNRRRATPAHIERDTRRRDDDWRRLGLLF